MGVVQVLSSSLTLCQCIKCPFFIRQSRQGAEAVSLMSVCVALEKGYFPKKKIKIFQVSLCFLSSEIQVAYQEVVNYLFAQVLFEEWELLRKLCTTLTS